MSDTLALDVSKLKVVDLRKELKSRGLSHTGDKAELVARLQAAINEEMHETTMETHDDVPDITLDSDEIDSDAVLDDDASLNGTVDEELALAENPPLEKEASPVPKPKIEESKLLKRKLISSESNKAKTDDNKEAAGKKIILNRVPISAPTETGDKIESNEVAGEGDLKAKEKKIVLAASSDAQSRLESRAKRFGLPLKITDEERKATRMQRFNQNKTQTPTSEPKIITSANNSSLSENLEKLKKRAERFGQNVSKVMTEIEMKERLEKRKEKFGISK